MIGGCGRDVGEWELGVGIGRGNVCEDGGIVCQRAKRKLRDVCP